MLNPNCLMSQRADSWITDLESSFRCAPQTIVVASALLLLSPIFARAADDVPAKVLNAPEVMKQCHYPPKSLQARTEGETLLSLVIDDAGKLSDIAVKQSSGSEELDNAALECMKKAQFQPATHDGHATTSKSVAPWRWTLPAISRTCDAAVSASSLASEKADSSVWPKPAYVCFCFGDDGEAQGKPTVVRSTGYRDADKMAVEVAELKSAAYQGRSPGCHVFGVKFDTNGRPREGFDDLVQRLNDSPLYPRSPNAPYLLPAPYEHSGIEIRPE